MVFMPPRHGKSEVVSKKFPAWFLGRNPDKEIIISSYAADLAYDFSRIARNTFREWGPKLWGLNLADDSGAVGRWGIQGRRGGLVAAGVGGPITGRGAHVAIIDDPFKNYEESASETVREKVLNWYKSTLRTRLAPGGAIVLVMTRWHEKDLAGELETAMTEEDGEQWEIIELPAIAKENDILGRQPGEPLWPARYPLTELRATKSPGQLPVVSTLPAEPARRRQQVQAAWFRYLRLQMTLCPAYAGRGRRKKRFPLNQCWCFQTCDPAASTRPALTILCWQHGWLHRTRPAAAGRYPMQA